jgi:hypothetical protein
MSEPGKPSAGERVIGWFTRPGPEASPGENLRFVRRMQLATVVLVVVVGARQTAFGEWAGPLLLGLAGLGLLSALVLTLAIRSADRRERDGA